METAAPRLSAAQAESDSVPKAPASTGSVHRILRNSTLNLVAQGLNATFNLLVVVILARSLSQDRFGLFSLLVALITAFQVVLELGVTTVLTCRIAQKPDTWRETVAEATGLMAVVVVVSFAGFLVFGLGWSWLRQDSLLLPVCAVAGLACAAQQVQRGCAGVFRAFEMFLDENLSRVVQGGLFIVFVLVLALVGHASLVTAMASFAFSHAVAAVYLLVRLQQQRHCLSWRFRFGRLRGWLAEAIPVGIGEWVRQLTWQLDTLLLGFMQTDVVVAIYSVAYKPLGPLNWLPRAVLQATFPAFARLAVGDPEARERAFASSIRLLWIISVPIAVAICICAEPVILLLAGPSYLEAVLPMRILIWIATLSFISFQFRFLFTAVGRQRPYAWLVVLVFAIEAAIEVVLIPHWSYLGACTGSMVGELVFTVLGLALCRAWGIGRIEWSVLLRTALAGAAMALALWWLRGLPILLLLPVVGVLTLGYFGLCVLLGALSWDEVRHFYEALTGRRAPAR
jgi:O-antigen/teichoic acid export membrane protein